MKLIVFITNVDWFFLSHRIDFAKNLIDKSYRVILLSKDTGSFKKISESGVECYDVGLTRTFQFSLSEFKSIWHLRKLVHELKPDLVHSVGIKSIVYSNIALLGLKYKILNAYSGLGYSLNSANSISKNIVEFLLKFSRLNNSFNLFQNNGDLQRIKHITSIKQNFLIPGNGIVKETYIRNISTEVDRISVVFASRLLKDKGIVEFLNASTEFEFRKDIEFIVAGEIDEENPNSLSKKELNEYKSTFSHIRWMGHVHDISILLKKTHVVILPSYHEGLPKILCEACLSGNIIIATNIPGCQPCVKENINGFLVPLKDSQFISDKIEFLLNNKRTIPEMQKKSMEIGEMFDRNSIFQKFDALYSNILDS